MDLHHFSFVFQNFLLVSNDKALMGLVSSGSPGKFPLTIFHSFAAGVKWLSKVSHFLNEFNKTVPDDEVIMLLFNNALWSHCCNYTAIPFGFIKIFA